MGTKSSLILYTLGGDSSISSSSPPPPIIMETILTPEEITELNTTGKVILTDDLMIRMKQFCDLVDTKITESYEDSDWYNDPNCVMSRHHY